ncbi:MAG: hypothetical protein ABIO30_08020 [Thermomonas sp.]
MTDIRQHDPSAMQLERARRGARRTAWLFAGIAFLVYAGFLLIGALAN